LSPAQTLGRRQRSTFEEPEDGGGNALASEADASRPATKRQRRDSMLTDHNNHASSSHASRPVTNGTHAVGNGFRDTADSFGHSGTAATMQNTTLNGSSNSAAGRLPDYFGHSREEVTRILIQALDDLGYTEAAEKVAHESGFSVESGDVAAFRHAVLSGDWQRAEQLLCGSGSNGSGIVLAPGADRTAMKFELRQQKFLEHLERGEKQKALAVLRLELTPICHNRPQIIQALSRYLMTSGPEDLRNKANWDGANGRSRHILLSKLRESISPSSMLPEHRLAVLLDCVKQSQIDNCLYHTSNEQPSLYVDHFCDRSRFPTEVLVELSKPASEATSRQAEEVWQIRFSPDGKRLASCGTEKAINIWDVERFTLVTQLEGHAKAGIGDVAWSPDGKYLVSCGFDRSWKLWDTNTGECLKVADTFEEPVSSCVWTDDGQTFVTGSLDKAKPLCTWDIQGNCLHTWTKSHRTCDIALSPDQHWLVAMTEQKQLHVYNFATRSHVYELSLTNRPTSISISADSRHMLVNKTDHEAVLIDIETRETVQKYTGQKGGQYTIRSDFGGANENFVICGSDDGHVFVWHKITGTLVHEAEAHQPRCNAVAWHPTDPCMFATCGDDNRVKIWSYKDRAKMLPGTSRQSNGVSDIRSLLGPEMWA